MRNKRLIRTLSALCLTLVLASGFTVPAFAQGAAPPPAEDTTNDSNVVVEETEKAPPLTPDGNAALVDDFGGNKQLITVTTKLNKRLWVSAEELELIHQKMQQYGTENLSAYLRKMALDGYVVKLELPELKELVSLMRRSSNNLNQLTRKVHETGRVYDADLEDISQRQEQLWEGVKEILTQLSKLS